MSWTQRQIEIGPYPSGLHLITREVIKALPEIAQCRIGLLHVFIQHTSASLTINENADPDVLHDLQRRLADLAPEDYPYRHTSEGPDDMPAHITTALLGSSLNIPVADGRLTLGTWQGIFLCEHRRRASRRQLVLTLQGEFAT